MSDKRITSDILKDSVPEAVGFSDKKPRKKVSRKAKKPPELDLFSTSDRRPSIVDFDEIEPAPVRKGFDKNDAGTWVMRDFAMYAQDLYMKMFNREWSYSLGFIALRMNSIHDSLVDLFGYCDNVMLRDYIKFVFDKHIKRLMAIYPNFSIKFFAYDDILMDFHSKYNYRKASKMETDPDIKDIIDDTIHINAKAVEAAYVLGPSRFVSDYGVLIAVNWLEIIKGLDREESVNQVLRICANLKSRGMFDSVIKATERYNPYPRWLPVMDYTIFMNEEDCKVKTVKDDSRFHFLGKGEKEE